MSPANTAELRALLEKATPGPWASGVYFVFAAVNDGTHKKWTPPPWIPFRRCSYCARKPEPCSNVRPASATDGTRHVSRDPITLIEELTASRRFATITLVRERWHFDEQDRLTFDPLWVAYASGRYQDESAASGRTPIEALDKLASATADWPKVEPEDEVSEA